MTQAVLTLNAGSSSLKAALFGIMGDRPMATGLADRIGPEAVLKVVDAEGRGLDVEPIADSHTSAIAAVIGAFRRRWPDLALLAVGHRVVHGGTAHAAPTKVDGSILAELETFSPFAPLHQPHNLAGIRAAMQAFPGVPQIACFDTAFHRGGRFVDETYALPREMYDAGVRRYGFHGLSYQSIAASLARLSPRLAAGRVVVAHLGNGASICAMRDGRSVATTMGFSPLDGLPMGTRCGQLDPGVLLYLMAQKGMPADEISDLLYRRSGLLGLSGLSNDMRTLEAAGTSAADEAIEHFVLRCRREVAAMAAALCGIDALIFTGGIGENARKVRAAICEGLAWLGLTLDTGRNNANAQIISTEDSALAALVIPTNEELVIADAARATVGLGDAA